MIESIAQVKCNGCRNGGNVHISLPHAWYGTNLCGGAIAINSLDDLHTSVVKGDILVTGNPLSPSHSMVVVSVTVFLGRHYVYVRGFNNTQTLGTGGYLQYDNADRDIHKSKYFHTQNNTTRFGMGFHAGGQLYRIPYATYVTNHASVVYNNCANGVNGWSYVGL
jgi:hypothetical protein